MIFFFFLSVAKTSLLQYIVSRPLQFTSTSVISPSVYMQIQPMMEANK